MSDGVDGPAGYLGEIRLFAGKVVPRGWALCDGQVRQIQEDLALYSVLGTAYGGNGSTTFALPDLRGRAPVGTGAAPGGPPRNRGQAYGTERVSLTPDQLPAHDHAMVASSGPATSRHSYQPNGASVNLARSTDGFAYKSPVTDLVGMHPAAVGPGGSGASHQNLQPYLALNLIICIQGVYPKGLDEA